MALSEPEISYLASQRLGRLATVGPDGAPQNNPVGVHYNAELGSIDIFGLNMGATRKFRNVQHNPRVALVVDDIASIDPWEVRGIEIRGDAGALSNGTSPEDLRQAVIRITPRRVISWNVDPKDPGMAARDLSDEHRNAGAAS